MVPGCWIGTFSLRKRKLFRATAPQYPRQAIVSFDAARLVIKSVRLVTLPDELLLDRPRPRPHRRVFDGHLVFERGRSGPCPALDQVQALARPLKIGFRAEICHVNDERIVLPPAARVAVPLPDIGG